MTTEERTPVTQRAASSSLLRQLARLGLLGYALLHLLVAWLAGQLAWNARRTTDSADQAGALGLVAATPLGHALLWVLAVGLAGLCLWQAVEVLRHHHRLPPPGRERRAALVQVVKTVGTAVLYGYLAVSAVRYALGFRQERDDERQAVRGVLSWPGGQALVVAVALVVVGIGVYTVRKGLRSDFLGEIDLDAVAEPLRRLTHRASQVGFVLKGVALVLVGWIVGEAAITFDPARATGLDGALRAVAAQPYGPWVLTGVATGLAAFAVYCLARARHPVG
ncbi:DUF1206 domain-containing protein [Blastococcus sp. SYSU D00820]